MVAIGNVLEFKDFQTLNNVEGEILNVYHYRIDLLSGAVSWEDFAVETAQVFRTQVIEQVITVQSYACQHTRLEINNLSNYATEYYSEPWSPTIIGLEVNDYLSASASWSFLLNRTTRETRHGHKRIAGVPVTKVINNVATAPMVSELNILAATLGSFQSYSPVGGVNVVIRPCIIRRGADVFDPPTVVNLVSGAQYRGVGTQTSRKQLLS